MRRRAFTATALAAVAAPPIAPVNAQEWPSKPLRMVIPYPPGGPSDVSTRIVMDRAAQSLGQPIVFDNKAGASGMIGGEFVKNQTVDNHTFLTTTTAMVCITRHLQPIPFDPDKDFVTVSRMCTSWGIFAIHPVGAGAHGRGVRGLRQGQPGQDQLRLVGPCHHHPPVRRDAAARGRHHDDPRALSRQRARHQRPDRGRGPGAVRPDLPAAREGGQAHRARHAVERPPSRLPRRARPCARRAIGKEEGDSWFGILAPTGTSPAVIAKLDKAIGDAVRAPDIVEKLHLGGCYVTYLNRAGLPQPHHRREQDVRQHHPEGQHQAARDGQSPSGRHDEDARRPAA